ncbi:SIMPL domain-containing protein [Streptomyces olivoreticuli]
MPDLGIFVKLKKASCESSAGGTISVSGTGESSTAPDIARLEVAVFVKSGTAGEALNGMGQAAQRLANLAREQGIQEKGILTSSLTLDPIYESNGGVTVLVGYQAEQSFSIKVYGISNSGSFLQAAGQEIGEGFLIEGIEFDVSDSSQLYRDARRAAYENALSAAKQYADLSGGFLGELISVNEEEQAGAPHPLLRIAGRTGSEASLPISPGQFSILIRAHSVYRLCEANPVGGC